MAHVWVIEEKNEEVNVWEALDIVYGTRDEAMYEKDKIESVWDGSQFRIKKYVRED